MGKVTDIEAKRIEKVMDFFLRIGEVMAEAEEAGLDGAELVRDGMKTVTGEGEMKPREAYLRKEA